ncbi:hypothetical protein ATR1_001d0006 [Acetobacter tropicalis]|nr:hypothetical protein ATR1_001d0006 [Acetobacter tropicalis]
MGFLARDQLPVVTLARDHLTALGAKTCDTVHLGIREGVEVLYLDKIPGNAGWKCARVSANVCLLPRQGLAKH